jgi:hypothetical protein
VHYARLEHWGRGLTACSGETVAAHWVEMVATEASASRCSGVELESLVVVSETKGPTLALASAAGSFWWLEELVRLREARPNVASRWLSME